MGDRIHPTLETEPPQKSVAVEIPQQQSPHHHTNSILLPPRLDHNDNTNHNPQPAAGKRRRRSRCCLISFSATLTSIILVLGIAVLALWLVLRPKAPTITITNVSISSIRVQGNLTSITTANAMIHATISFIVKAENPNTKIGFYYRNVYTTLSYEEQEIGKGSVPDFYHGHRNTTFLHMQIVGSNITLTPSVGYSLNSTLSRGSNFWLQARTHTKVRIKIGSWTSKDSTVRVNCDVEISNPITSSTISIVRKTCRFKLESLRLL